MAYTCWLLFLLPLCVWGQDRSRVDCYPDGVASREVCEARDCIWIEGTPEDPPGIPFCFMKIDKIGYTRGRQNGDAVTLNKNAGPLNPFGQDLAQITFTSKSLPTGGANVRIAGSQQRYEPDVLNLPRRSFDSSDGLTVTANLSSDPFYFYVQRNSNGRKIFDTSIGGLIFSDKFIQIVTRLPSHYLYGFGEHIHQEISHDFTRYTTWGMLARDEAPDSYGHDTKNLYGVHPFYLVVEPDGKAHGVLILNTNAQEVTTLPEPALVYRTIGGILDIYFFPGPTPHDVTKQYLSFIGRPFLPAYWALGYQMCRYGYKSLDDMKTRVQAVRDYQIPFDVAYADIDYMERYKDFTTGKQDWSGFGDYARQLHSWGMSVILIFDPAVEVDYDSFSRGRDAQASFIEWERVDQVQRSIQNLYPLANDTKIMLGVVWPDKHVAFPDFLDSTGKTEQWWIDEFVRYHDEVPFDGAWIDMNEPSVFSTNDGPSHMNLQNLKCPINAGEPDSEWDAPPYQTASVYFYGNNQLSTKTLCMLAVADGGKQRFYNTKNLYGWSESKSTQKAVQQATKGRGAVISRSTFISSGRYTGHWLGDNTARWEDLRTAVIGAQEFNLFGIPYVGSDVCGFIGVTNEELCLRWHQMAAFHSFYRNHNADGLPYQDPAVWPSVAAATRKANEFRYAYLPYLFSLHFRASLYGEPVVRPVFYEFPSDSETYSLSEQFMWGPAVLVAPVLYQGATSVEVYVPSNDFFSLFDYTYGSKISIGRTVFPSPTTSRIPTFVRGGNIIPRQSSAVTTTESRKTSFQLLVAPLDRQSSGELFWDDGNAVVQSLDTHPYYHITFQYNVTGTAGWITFNTTRTADGVTLPGLNNLEIFDYPSAPLYSSFTLDGTRVGVNTQASRYNALTRILTVQLSNNIDISSLGTHTLSWTHGDSLLATNRVQ